MNRNRQLVINLISASVAFVVNIGINFLLSPYIVESIGVAAYGFWGLANNFVSYASIITIALNSMAGRFFAIEVQRKNWSGANKYFSSIFFANIVAVGIMLIPSTMFILQIDNIIHVPFDISVDVSLLFGLIFLNFFINMVALAFSLAPFAKNIIYLSSLRQIESIFLKAGLLVGLFFILKPRVWFLGFATLSMTVYRTVFGFYYTAKLLPEIKLKRSYCDIRAIKELLSSGFWNVVNHLGRLLATGLDLLIANLFIDPTAMGVLALSRIIPTFIESMVSSLASVFAPEFTMLYAQNDTTSLVKSIKRSIKILGITVNIPIAILFSFGPIFFKLWVPSQDAHLLHLLSMISVFAYVFSGATNSFFGVFLVTNNLRTNSLLVLLTGLLNVLTVFVLLKITNLGLYAIAGISTIFITVRNLTFTIPFGAKYIGLPWYTFFPDVIKSVTSFSILAILGYSIQKIVTIDSWASLLVFSLLLGMVGVVINFYMLLSLNERSQIYSILKRKIFGKTSDTQ